MPAGIANDWVTCQSPVSVFGLLRGEQHLRCSSPVRVGDLNMNRNDKGAPPSQVGVLGCTHLGRWLGARGGKGVQPRVRHARVEPEGIKRYIGILIDLVQRLYILHRRRQTSSPRVLQRSLMIAP
jgi:hypothetical protein